jgi:NADH dehydrogenase [ubiquinone] 1 alpha subcomplex assembly factor 6
LFALYAFNLEIAKVRETVSEPMLGEIRLQWWREAVEEAYGGGAVRKHAVAEPLADAIRRHAMTRDHFGRLIDARAFDLGDEPPETVADLVTYAEDTSSRLVRAALDILGASDNEAAAVAARHVGIAWAIVGLIRAMPHHLHQRRLYLPAELENRFAVVRRDMLELRNSASLVQAVEALATVARDELAAARAVRAEVPRAALPALLVAKLADGHLKRLARAGYNVFDPKIAQRAGLMSARLAFAAARGRY